MLQSLMLNGSYFYRQTKFTLSHHLDAIP